MEEACLLGGVISLPAQDETFHHAEVLDSPKEVDQNRGAACDEVLDLEVPQNAQEVLGEVMVEMVDLAEGGEGLEVNRCQMVVVATCFHWGEDPCCHWPEVGQVEAQHLQQGAQQPKEDH